MEVVVLAPRCQSSDLLPVGRLVAVSVQADDSRVVSKLSDSVEGRCGTQPWGAPLLKVRVEDVMVPIRTLWGLPVRKLRIQSQRAVLSPRSLSWMRSKEGTVETEAELTGSGGRGQCEGLL